MGNILVFEKERIVCLDIKTIFLGEGFNVVFGNSVRELSGHQVEPALVILDIMSYKLFEKENLWTLLGYNSAKQVPLILSYSGKDFEPQGEIQHEMNVIGKVMKPYDSSQLVDIYRNYCKTIEKEMAKIPA